jgi:hypothetical protein
MKIEIKTNSKNDQDIVFKKDTIELLNPQKLKGTTINIIINEMNGIKLKF